ncbi:MAG: 50S ribosomal protein L29 [Candidatus Doudnabacteria bacterium]|nr:50S ribosomal protein L29 [Candidatus Doudnabacteria bacterium]
MKYKELTTKSEAEIKHLLLELKGNAHDLSVKMKLSQHKNVKELAGIKKDIARVMTYLRQKTAVK